MSERHLSVVRDEPERKVYDITVTVHGADECPRCSLERFNWLDCTCGLNCRKVMNCNGLK